MRIERRKHNRALMDFLGESLGRLWKKNLEIFAQKKSIKLFRQCEEWKKFGPLLCRSSQ